MIVHLCSHSCYLPRRSDLTLEQRRLAEITEMIHTASLVHDDVLDECSVRRGAGLAEPRMRLKRQSRMWCQKQSTLMLIWN